MEYCLYRRYHGSIPVGSAIPIFASIFPGKAAGIEPERMSLDPESPASPCACEPGSLRRGVAGSTLEPVHCQPERKVPFKLVAA